MPTQLTSFILALTTAVFTSIFTVALAMRRFQREQVWAKKLDSYTRILDALHVVRVQNEREETAILHKEKYDSELPANPEAEEKARAAYSDLRRNADTGGLIISDHATKLLADFFHQCDDDDPNEISFEYHARIAAKAKDAIAAMKTEARRDLSLSQWRFF